MVAIRTSPGIDSKDAKAMKFRSSKKNPAKTKK
jgi:hypothetical protein